ncbi:type IV pilus modification PilV family protein [Arenimonas sp. MALMAid1274]|uniref:type IV pilus modification PilV family protein n=1 Tax=Arenimonas sp. MALMAid1274 TaxID=3411630 RepID=UPI003BA170F0
MKHQRGFSLIEVILAFSLLAATLGILIAILSGGLAQVKNAGDATEAALHAQSLLDELGVLEPIEPGSAGGQLDRGRYRWQRVITEVEDPAPVTLPPNEAGATPVESVGRQFNDPVVYRIELDLSWGEGDYARSLRFTTLRVRIPENPVGLVP